MEKYWWQEQPLTIAAIQMNLYGKNDKAFDEYVSQSHFNAEQLYHLIAKGKGAVAFYNEKTDGMVLDRYLEKAHGAGIREIVYYNTHVIDAETAKEKPDYFQYNETGKPIFAYDIFHQVCVNPNGAWHKSFLRDLENICKHDIDGIFLDGPVMNPMGCYCRYCQADFEKRFGRSIYTSTKRERREQHVELVTQHVKEAYETVKRVNPKVAIYLNNSALRADVIGVNPRKVSPYVDLLGAEGGFHAALMGEGLWKVGAFAKHLSCLNGNRLQGAKPSVNFIAGNQSGISSYLHTPAETRLTYAQSLANGQNVWYGTHFDVFEALELDATKAAKDMNAFILKHKDLFKASATCARVALMWSSATANNYASSVEESDFTSAEESGFADRGDHRAALFSAYDMLARNHIQFDIVDEKSVEAGELAKYEALIMPEVACISDATAEQIKAYVKNGGNVLANFDVGCYDEKGAFMKTSNLAELFGFVSFPKLHKGRVGRAYAIKTKSHSLTDGLTMFRIPSPLLNLEYEFSDDAEVLMTTHAPNLSPFDYDKKPQYPAIIKRCYGKGNAYYISGNLYETVNSRNNADYARIVRAFCDISSKPTVVSDEAGLYEIVLRRQEDRFVLHIVNLTGAMSRPVEKIVPLYNVRIQLNLSGFGIEKTEYNVTSIRNARINMCNKNGTQIEFVLDKIDDYEIIVIE